MQPYRVAYECKGHNINRYTFYNYTPHDNVYTTFYKQFSDAPDLNDELKRVWGFQIKEK